MINSIKDKFNFIIKTKFIFCKLYWNQSQNRPQFFASIIKSKFSFAVHQIWVAVCKERNSAYFIISLTFGLSSQTLQTFLLLVLIHQLGFLSHWFGSIEFSLGLGIFQTLQHTGLGLSKTSVEFPTRVGYF